MKLKNKFLTYVEYQKNAEYILRTQGPNASNAAFAKANDVKQEVLNLIDEYEIDLDPDKRNWYYDGDGTKRMKE